MAHGMIVLHGLLLYDHMQKAKCQIAQCRMREGLRERRPFTIRANDMIYCRRCYATFIGVVYTCAYICMQCVLCVNFAGVGLGTPPTNQHTNPTTHQPAYRTFLRFFNDEAVATATVVCTICPTSRSTSMMYEAYFDYDSYSALYE